MNRFFAALLVAFLVAGSLAFVGCGKNKVAGVAEKKEQAKRLLPTGNWAQINTLLQDSVGGNPKDPEAQFLLGLSFYNLKNYPSALDHLQIAVNLDPGNMQARLIIGNSYRDAHQTDKAEATYRDLISRAPDYSQPYINLAALLDQLGRSKDAIALLEQGSAKANGPDVLIELGDRYVAEKQPDKAKDAYRKALRVDPESARAKAALSELK